MSYRTLDFLAIMLTGCLAAWVGPARAEVEKQLLLECDGQKLCPYFRPLTPIPEGWRIDPAGVKDGVVLLVPKDVDLEKAPYIYLRATFRKDQASVAEIVKADQARIAEEEKGTTFKDLEPEKSLTGRPDFPLYQIVPPQDGSGSHEVIATFIDKDQDGNTFSIGAAVAADTEEDLAKALPVFRWLVAHYK